MSADAAVAGAVQKLLPDAQRFLQELMRFPSTPGQEADAMGFLKDKFGGPSCAVEEVGMSDRLLDDPEYSDPIPGLKYDGRCNLRLERPGTGKGRTLLFNTHVDVVPPSEGMTDPWSAREEGGAIHGRGACDAKGQVTAIYLALKALDALSPKLPGSVVVHLVCEEENGGNGTLAMTRRGERADGCIVLEPTGNRLHTSVRGAVWFRLTFRGTAGHSGQPGKSRSALLMAREAIGILETFHAKLLREAKGIPLFDPYPNPMPLTFGRMVAGNWPSSAPSQAVVEGVLGFLPNRNRDQVRNEIRRALVEGATSFGKDDFDLHLMYRHDCSVADPEGELPRALLSAAAQTGVELETVGMPASCDAWFYNNLLGIPTVVYGPGTLSVAHSKDEHIRMSDIASAACVLIGTIRSYCGGGAR